MPKKTKVQSEFHDYYNQNNSDKNYSIFLSNTDNRISIVKNILIGKPITKISFNNK